MRYRVKVREQIETVWIVEAEDDDEALNKAQVGNGDIEDQYTNWPEIEDLEKLEDD